MLVEINTKRVAWFDSEQQFCVEGVASELKSQVEKNVKEWVDKRAQ